MAYEDNLTGNVLASLEKHHCTLTLDISCNDTPENSYYVCIHVYVENEAALGGATCDRAGKRSASLRAGSVCQVEKECLLHALHIRTRCSKQKRWGLSLSVWALTA